VSEKVIILLPALNENDGIVKTIKEVPLKILKAKGFTPEIVVADSGSTDGTQKVVRDLGIRVIQSKKGKGRTVREAIEILKHECDYLFMLDSDFTYPPSYISIMILDLEYGRTDVIIGSRLKGIRQEGSMSESHFIGNVGLTYIANKLFNTPISDLCTGYWGFTKEALVKLNLRANFFELEANIYTEIDRNNLIITEVPIVYRKREGEASKLKYKDGFKIAWWLLKERILR
jgi:glycosyltransferase involved in cell wall biosynthesis